MIWSFDLMNVMKSKVFIVLWFLIYCIIHHLHSNHSRFIKGNNKILSPSVISRNTKSTRVDPNSQGVRNKQTHHSMKPPIQSVKKENEWPSISDKEPVTNLVYLLTSNTIQHFLNTYCYYGTIFASYSRFCTDFLLK